MAKREYEFPRILRDQAWLRQDGLCAWCGRKLWSLIREMYIHAHHVVPDQAAQSKSPEYSWLKTLENCVMLCEECHREFGHQDGRFRTGAVPFARHYRFSHGPDRRAHGRWAATIDARPWPK
jgi:5-methylcytosine-specific restriction endonuclease McrA